MVLNKKKEGNVYEEQLTSSSVQTDNSRSSFEVTRTLLISTAARQPFRSQSKHGCMQTLSFLRLSDSTWTLPHLVQIGPVLWNAAEPLGSSWVIKCAVIDSRGPRERPGEASLLSSSSLHYYNISRCSHVMLFFADCIADLIMSGKVWALASWGSLLALPSQYHGLVIQKQMQIRCLQTVNSLRSYAASLEITRLHPTFRSIWGDVLGGVTPDSVYLRLDLIPFKKNICLSS